MSIEPTTPPVAEQPLPPKTTTQEDLTTAGQRKINLVWEYTQAAIAILVTITAMVVMLYMSITGRGIFPQLLGMAWGMIIGFYFSRTNHAAIGGIGQKPNAPYEGR